MIPKAASIPPGFGSTPDGGPGNKGCLSPELARPENGEVPTKKT